jgi:hypothetical protein
MCGVQCFPSDAIQSSVRQQEPLGRCFGCIPGPGRVLFSFAVECMHWACGAIANRVQSRNGRYLVAATEASFAPMYVCMYVCICVCMSV